MAIKGRCKIVYIPADVNEPIQEQELPYTEESEVGCVQNYAKVVMHPSVHFGIFLI